MSEEQIKWVGLALKGNFGWLVAVFMWRGALAWSVGLVSLVAKTALEAFIPEDKAWAIALFNHRGYRVAAVLLRVLTSIQLPKMALGKPTGAGNTEIFTKPSP
jgi:hypothetical protein